MNKKATINLSIGTIVIIVLAMAMFIAGVILIQIIFTPQFKITKEVCDIDVTTKDLAFYSRDLVKLNSCRLDLIEAKNNYERVKAMVCVGDYEKLTSINERYETQTCKQVEVDEIGIPQKIVTFERTVTSEGAVTSKRTVNVFWVKTELNSKNKQDLTTDWLDKNCMCSARGEEGAKEDYARCMGYERDVFVDNGIQHYYCEKTAGKCTRYKCANYTVEVKR